MVRLDSPLKQSSAPVAGSPPSLALFSSKKLANSSLITVTPRKMMLCCIYYANAGFNLCISFCHYKFGGEILSMKKTHDEKLVADVHALSAGLKAYVTTYTAKSLSICWEACGGHGYAAVNQFGSLMNGHDIFQTFEGDNAVFLEQVAADLLKQYQRKFRGGTFAVTWICLRESMNIYLS